MVSDSFVCVQVVAIMTALLLERRLVVQCGNLSVLTRITLALPWILRPYAWVNSYLPLLPPALLSFLEAPVPYIAGVLAPPTHGYEEGIVVVVVEDDVVLGGEQLPHVRALDELVLKLSPPHEHLSLVRAGSSAGAVMPGANEGGTASATTTTGRTYHTSPRHTSPRSLSAAAEGGMGPARPFMRVVRNVDNKTLLQVVKGMLLITTAQVSSIIPLRELRGLSVSLQKPGGGGAALGAPPAGVSEEIKTSLVRMADNYDKLFVHELVHTQLFEAFYSNHILAWFVVHPLPSLPRGGSGAHGGSAVAKQAALEGVEGKEPGQEHAGSAGATKSCDLMAGGEDAGQRGGAETQGARGAGVAVNEGKEEEREDGSGDEEEADTPTSEKTSASESGEGEDSEDDSSEEEDGEFVTRDRHNCTVRVLTDEVADLSRKLQQSQMEKALLEEARCATHTHKIALSLPLPLSLSRSLCLCLCLSIDRRGQVCHASARARSLSLRPGVPHEPHTA